MTPVSVPSPPCLGDVVVFVQVLAHPGLLNAIQERVRVARASCGQDDTIDGVVILSGSALLKALYERLKPFAASVLALCGRSRVPDRSIRSRGLAAGGVLRTLFLAGPGVRTPVATPGSVSDRHGTCWWVMDVDGTTHAAREHRAASPHGSACPSSSDDPDRRSDSTGRTRGEVLRTRTTVFQAFTHHWIGTAAGKGHGTYHSELQRALEVITWSAPGPLGQILVRLDGVSGHAAPVVHVVTAGLARPPERACRHPESGACRSMKKHHAVLQTSTRLTGWLAALCCTKD
jgi:hypothetical protein